MIYNSKKYNLDGDYAKNIITDEHDFHRFSYIMHDYFQILQTNKTKHAKIFPIDILYYADFCKTVDVLKFLGQTNCKRLSQGKAVLVFYYAHESFHPGNIIPTFDNFKLFVIPQLKKIGIPFKNIFFITGDLKTYSLYNIGVEEINFIGIDIFSERVSQKLSKYIPDDYFTSETRFSLTKKKDFLYLNGCPRPGKCVLKYHLEQQGVLSNKTSLYSWMHRHSTPNIDKISRVVTEFSIRYKNSSEEILKSCNKINLLDANHTTLNKLQDQFPKKFIKETCFNLVPETSVTENMFFITEKTYKTILYKHPFLFWGNSFMLTYLRSLGYITFGNIFDEEYDNISVTSTSSKNFSVNNSLDNKMQIISDNIKNFRERAIGQEKIVNEIINYNRNLLITNNPAAALNKKRLSAILEKVETL